MSLETACANYAGICNFTVGAVGSAVWFQRDADGSVRKFTWQGIRLVKALQFRLGFDARGQDGKWGTNTNTRLKSAMTRIGLDPSIVREGTITREMLQAALLVTYSLSMTPVPASPTVQVCVPIAATLPVWNTAGASDGGRGADPVAVVVEGPTSSVGVTDTPWVDAPPVRWQRPTGSTVLSAGPDSSGRNVIVYRLASGETRRALTDPDNGQLVKDVAVPPADAPQGTVAPGSDPGTLAPGATQAPGATVSPQVQAYVNPTSAPAGMTTQKKLVIGASVLAGAAVVIAVIVAIDRSSRKAAAPVMPPQAQPPALPAGAAVPGYAYGPAQAPQGAAMAIRSNPGGIDPRSAQVVSKVKRHDGMHNFYMVTVRFRDPAATSGYRFYNLETDALGHVKALPKESGDVRRAIIQVVRARFL